MAAGWMQTGGHGGYIPSGERDKPALAGTCKERASDRSRLEAYGIAAPVRGEACAGGVCRVACPHCGSGNTERISEFGSTACKALYQCRDCQEPFDYFKEI